MKKGILFVTALVIVFHFLSLTSQAQERDNIYDTIYSQILKEKRPLLISLPDTYRRDSSVRYDVLYVLDGEWNTSLAKTTRHFLEYGKFIPPNIIIVGIPNLYKDDQNLRDRDFTPTAIKEMPSSGGAASFLSFLKNELLPHLDSIYPTNPQNSTLYGTSLGGLFALYAFLQEPLLFKSYLTVEPSLWWDNGYVNGLALQKIATVTNLKGSLWIASRDGEGYRSMGIAKMDSILKTQAPKGLNWKVETYPNETHFSAIWKGIYDGYKFTYQGMIPEGDLIVAPRGGRLVKGKPFLLRCFNTSPENYLHYTIDGSEPTLGSTPLKPESSFTFSEPTLVTIKSLSVRKEYEKRIQCRFEVEDQPMAPIPKPKEASEGGLTYTYYKGEWKQLPEFNKIKGSKKGVAHKDFNMDSLDSQGGFALVLEGFLQVPVEGYYLVDLYGSPGSKAWVGQQLVIGHTPDESNTQNFLIYLRGGIYPYKVAYLHTKEDGHFSPLRWYRAEGEMMLPAEVEYLYRKK